jgi:hypothetical protein
LAHRRVTLFFWPTRLVGKPDFYGGGLDALFMPDLRQALRKTS